LTWVTPVSEFSMMAFSGSIFCMELVMSSHRGGGRRNESSASEHTVSLFLVPKQQVICDL
jgi:hypothetical protein